MPGICPRCSRNVYFAEEKLALGKVWHYLCFSCRNCRKLLNSWSITTYDGDLYCQKCCPKAKTIKCRDREAEVEKSSCHWCSTSHYVKTNMWISKSNDEDDDPEKISEDEPISSSQCSILSRKESSIYSQRSSESHELEISNETKIIKSELKSGDMDLELSSKLQESIHENNSLENPIMIHSASRKVSFDLEDLSEIMRNPSETCENGIIGEITSTKEERLRGGSGCRCASNSRSSESSVEHGCCSKPIKSCMQQPQSHRAHGHNEESVGCTSNAQGCGNGGYCGGGCRGGCGKSGQTCLPIKPCATPLGSCRKAPSYPPMVPDIPRCYVHRNGSKSPCITNTRHRQCHDDGNCSDTWRGPSVGCECLGGGLDCQRCGRKVYQAEMQIASGVPYHNICFSCYCCRKPLETLTYHESCGEIYCKQCYIRNFGPQGYGYSGVLQTPM